MIRGCILSVECKIEGNRNNRISNSRDTQYSCGTHGVFGGFSQFVKSFFGNTEFSL